MEITCRVYKPKDPRKTPLYGLLDSLYQRVKGVWEERFERSYGFWRGLVDEVVASYLACGLWQGGFARVRCRRCPKEFLVAFSCKRRGVCPSCAAKRAVELAAFLRDEIVEQVGHAQWVFTIPKMLRIYFLHHRELLGALSLAAYQTVKELMAAAVEEKSFRPGMVSVVQTFGEGARFHPHVHALVSRGGWTACGEWIPLPYVDEGAAEKLFRHKVLALLRRRGLLSQERIDLLLSWRRSGFSVHNRVFVHPRDGREFEALVRYMMRPPVSLSRLHFTPGSHEVVYVPKKGHHDIEPAEAERIDAMELRQRRASHRHCRFPPLSRTGPWPGSSSRSPTQGAISCATTAPTRTPPAASTKRLPPPPSPPLRDQAPEDAAIPDEPHRAALRRRWAELIRRVYEVDPLVCPRCGSEMRVIGFITEPALINRILDHLRKRDQVASRPPPHSPQPSGHPPLKSTPSHPQ